MKAMAWTVLGQLQNRNHARFSTSHSHKAGIEVLRYALKLFWCKSCRLGSLGQVIERNEALHDPTSPVQNLVTRRATAPQGIGGPQRPPQFEQLIVRPSGHQQVHISGTRSRVRQMPTLELRPSSITETPQRHQEHKVGRTCRTMFSARSKAWDCPRPGRPATCGCRLPPADSLIRVGGRHVATVSEASRTVFPMGTEGESSQYKGATGGIPLPSSLLFE